MAVRRGDIISSDTGGQRSRDTSLSIAGVRASGNIAVTLNSGSISGSGKAAMSLRSSSVSSRSSSTRSLDGFIMMGSSVGSTIGAGS